MDKKLTLSLNESVVENAKQYAKEHKISLSRLVENYLKSVSEGNTKDMKITPLVKSLSGVITLPADFDAREQYTDYLMEKYQ